MNIVGTSKITAKGQVTLPSSIRKLLNLHSGENIAFCLSKDGVIISRCKISVEESGFRPAEWRKIEGLANEKGIVVHDAASAKRSLRKL